MLHLENQPCRSSFLLVIRALLSDAPGTLLARDIRHIFNTPQYRLQHREHELDEPTASGDFRTVAAVTTRDDSPRGGGDESTMETSTAIDAYVTAESSVAGERPGHAVVRISQESRFVYATARSRTLAARTSSGSAPRPTPASSLRSSRTRDEISCEIRTFSGRDFRRPRP
jgi:hypothetical protein